MRVAIMHGSNDLYGASRVLVNEVQALTGLGHEVVVVVPTTGDLTTALRELSPFVTVVVDPTLAVLRRTNLVDALHRPVLPAAVAKADAVVVWTLALAHYVPLLRIARKPFYVSVHELLTDRAGALLIGLLRRGAFPVQACSYAVRDWLVSRGIDIRRIFVCYPVFDAAVPSNSSMRRPDVVTTSGVKIAVVGRVNGCKGHLEVARAFHDFPGASDSDELHLFGAPFAGQERHLEEVQRVSAQDGRITYRGQVPSMSSLAGFSALAAFPTRPEPFGLVPIEAWQQGVPTIGYADGGAREVLAMVGGTPVRRSYDTVQDISDALIQVWSGLPSAPPSDRDLADFLSFEARLGNVEQLVRASLSGPRSRHLRVGRRWCAWGKDSGPRSAKSPSRESASA